MSINFKELARALLQGWCDSHNNDHREFEQVFMDAGFKEPEAEMLTMFSHWSNDLLSLFGTSPDIRLTMEENKGKVEVADVPEPPTEFTAAVDEYTHLYWNPGQYRFDSSSDEQVWIRGGWMLYRESIAEREDKAR